MVVPLEASFEMGSLLDWVAGSSTSSYQLQESDDGRAWENLGAVFVGDLVSSAFVAGEASFYQVVETSEEAEVIHSVTKEPGFEISWLSTEGRNYQVTSSDHSMNFTTVEGTQDGNGTVLKHAGAVDESRRFFRVEEVESP